MTREMARHCFWTVTEINAFAWMPSKLKVNSLLKKKNISKNKMMAETEEHVETFLPSKVSCTWINVSKRQTWLNKFLNRRKPFHFITKFLERSWSLVSTFSISLFSEKSLQAVYFGSWHLGECRESSSWRFLSRRRVPNPSTRFNDLIKKLKKALLKVECSRSLLSHQP